MKRILLGMTLLGLLGTTGVGQAIGLGINGPVGPILQGSSVTVEVVISGLGNGTAPSLGSFDLDLAFDPAILGYTSASLGDPVLGDQLDLLGLGATGGIGLSGPGLLDLWEVSLDSATDLNDLQADAFVLATVSFNALGSGTAALVLSAQGLGDANGDPLTAAPTGATFTIQPLAVPAPSVLALLGWGLIGGFPRRRRDGDGNA